MNQSIFAMLDRYVGHEIIPILTKGANGVPASDKHVVFILWIASIAIFSVMVLFIFRGNLPQGSKIVNAEWSVVLIFSVLFGTVCWKAYLVVLLLPNALLFKTWISPHVDLKTRKIVGIFLFLPSIMAGMNSRELIGKNLSGRLEMASLFTISTLILLSGLMWYRVRCGVNGDTLSNEL